MGIILDSSILITAERRGNNARQMLAAKLSPGGVFGGGKGALIGAAAGGAAGTGLAAATGKEEAVIHAETAMTFTLRETAHTK